MKSEQIIKKILYVGIPVWLMTVCAVPVMAAVITWDGSKSTGYTDPENWVGGIRPASSLVTDIARFDDTNAIPFQPTINANWSVNGVQFAGSGWTVGRSGTSTLTIGNGGVSHNPVSAGAATFNSKLGLGANQAWDVGASSTINANGGIGGAAYTLTKTGAGRLVIRGGTDNTNTLGAIVVSAGELLVTSGTLDARLASVTVNSGALLGGAGNIFRPVTIENGGTLAAGFDAAGTLTVGDLSLKNSSILAFELGSLLGTNDKIAAQNLVLDGLLNVTNLGGLQVGSYTLMTYSGTLTDNGLTINNVPVGFSGSISASGGIVNLNITTIPEPTTISLFVISSLGLIIIRRHRRG